MEDHDVAEFRRELEDVPYPHESWPKGLPESLKEAGAEYMRDLCVAGYKFNKVAAISGISQHDTETLIAIMLQTHLPRVQ